MPQPPRTTTFGANDGCQARPTRGATLLKSAVTVESYFASWIWLRSIGVPGLDGETDRQRREVELEERRVGRHLESRLHAQLRRRVGQVVVADAAIALGEGAEDVVAEAGVEGQPAAELASRPARSRR